ncbi:MAG: hypothetical protein H0W84_05980 [Bacteroidetes bacterium]|nr:hypothetical protein [Bacteroidota bacterium]
MGCLKLAYRTNDTALKVVHRKYVRSGNSCTEAYSYGFNSQEKVDEISGSGNHNTAEFWEYDTRLGARWNLDPVTEPSISPYATNEDNPIKNDDLNGDCPNCKVEGKASVTLTFGTKGQSRINFAAGIGASKTNGNFMSGANLSLNLYSGGPGTTQGATGQSSFGAAITLGLSGTYGSGSGRPTDLNMFNSTTISGITNNFDKSATIGTNLTYNNATGFNRAAGYAGKLGGVTATINEDFSFFSKGGLIASGKDEGETGGGFLGYTFKNGTSLFAGTEIFTGRPTGYPKVGDGTGYVLQPNEKQYALNVGRSFLKVENAQNFGSIRFDYSGKSQMWMQNGIHNVMKIDHFKSSAENSFQVTR